MLGARTATWAKAGSGPRPDWDYRVKYLIGDGVAYIDTGILPSNDVSVEFSCCAVSNSTQFFFGSRRAAELSDYSWCMLITPSTGYRMDWIGANSWPTFIPYNYKVDIFANTTLVRINDVSKDVVGKNLIQYPFFYFSTNTSGVASAPTVGWCGELTIKKGDNVVLHYIPCVKNGVACMYDEATGLYVYSSSAGVFTEGTRVNDDGSEF